MVVVSDLTRDHVRRMLDEDLRTDADLEAFCLDYFPHIQRRFGRGMERTAKVNLLLELEHDLARIVEKLRIYSAARPEPAKPARSGTWRLPALRIALGLTLGIALLTWLGPSRMRYGLVVPGLSGPVEGSCAERMVEGLFTASKPARPELRALIVRFNGDDDASAALGVRVGGTLRGALEDYVRIELKPEQSELPAAAVRVKFVPCTIVDHEHARRIGEAAGADVVLWGQAFCNLRNRQECQTMPLAGLTPAATPEVQGSFTTSLTVIEWQGLEAGSGKLVELRRLDTVAAMELPRLVSTRPQQLLDVVLGLYASRVHRYGLAAGFFDRAQKAGNVSAGADGARKLNRMIGRSYIIAGHRDPGLRALRAAQAACEPSDAKCILISLYDLTWAMDHFGDVRGSLEYFERLLTLLQSRNDVSSQVGVLSHIAEHYDDLNDHEKGRATAEKALALVKQVGTKSMDSADLTSVARMYHRRGDVERAKEYYTIAMQRAEEDHADVDYAVSLGNIATAYIDMKDSRQALEYFKRALPILEKAGAVANQATVLNNMGRAYGILNEEEQALSVYRAALELERKSGNEFHAAAVLWSMGSIYYRTDRPALAISHFQQSAEAWLRLESPDLKQAEIALETAIHIAVMRGLLSEAEQLIGSLHALHPAESKLAQWEAALAARRCTKDEAQAYERLGALVTSAPEKDQARLRWIADAGKARAQNKAQWNCRGLLLTKVEAGSNAAKLGLVAGDVVVKIEGRCVSDPEQLLLTQCARDSTEPVSLLLWRGNKLQAVRTTSGPLGAEGVDF